MSRVHLEKGGGIITFALTFLRVSYTFCGIPLRFEAFCVIIRKWNCILLYQSKRLKEN